jgi:transcriptional regulator with XRE-family HTH domain
VNEAERWVEFGVFLREQRDKVGLSRRDAARKAKVPEATWKDLENGHKTSYGGVRVLPNPGTEVLAKIAEVLELPPEELNRHVGRLSNKSRTASAASSKDNSTSLAQKIARLGDRDRRLIESMVDQMLELE